MATLVAQHIEVSDSEFEHIIHGLESWRTFLEGSAERAPGDKERRHVEQTIEEVNELISDLGFDPEDM